MTPVIPFPKRFDSTERPASRDSRSGISMKASPSPLLEYLKSISGDREIQEVIQLLHDIRHFQDHPEMIQAFSEHDHEIAHSVKDHDRDVMELLVEDYLRYNHLMPTGELPESQKVELELHVKLVVMSTLKGYQEVVEGIREGVKDIASRLREDESIGHVTELVGTLRNREDRKALSQMLGAASELDEARHVLQSDRDDVHDILAEIAMKKGYHSHEAAARYLKEKLHGTLQDFESSLQAKAETADTDTPVRDLGMDILQRNRHANPRLNAALSILEGLRSRFGSKDLPGGLANSFTHILDDPSDENVEQIILKKSSAIHIELVKLEEEIETLAEIYLQALKTEDYKIQRGIQKISRIKSGRTSPEEYQRYKAIPDACPELRAILDDEADLVPAIIKVWLREDYGNIEFFERLVEKVTGDAQCYLDSDSPSEYVPYSTKQPENRKDLVRQVEYPRFGSAADHLKQVVRAVNEGPEMNPEVKVVIDRLSLSGSHFSEQLVDHYMDQKQLGLSPYRTFEDYLAAILSEVQSACDDEKKYTRLLTWRPKRTIPAAAAPPDNTPLPPEPDLRRRDTLIYSFEPPEEAEVMFFDEKELEPKKEPYVYEGRDYRVEKGSLTEVIYAMTGSTIEVEDGAKLDLFMASEDVTIKLKGNHSYVRVRKAGRSCKNLRILGPQGRVSADDPNVEFGEGVTEKLEV